MNLKKGDKVKVIAGKDKGKEAEIMRILPQKGKIIVEGVNVVKRHVKPGVVSKEGGIISLERAIDASNVMLVCEKCQKPTRIGYTFVNNKKYRVCKKCTEVLDK